MAFGLGDIFKFGGNLIGSLVGGGGGSSDNNFGNALAALLAGQLTSQRIPGQVTAGEYTPAAGGFGTYNYIPTGATQIDPALIAQIMGLAGGNNAAMARAQGLNDPLLSMGINNPYFAGLQGAAGQAGQMGANYANALGLGQQWIADNHAPVWDAATGALANYSTLLDQARNNPLAQSYIGGATNIGQGLTDAGQQIQGAAMGALGGAQDIASQLLANPYSGMAQAGANTAGGMLQNAGMQQNNLGQLFSGQVVSGLPAISSILNTAFDPQNALYNQTLQRTQDQLGTQLARMGITDSGVGARLASDTLRDFNIDWQNRALDRQLAGLQGYTQGLSGAGAQLGTGGNLQTAGAQAYLTGSQLPYTTYQGIGQGNLGTLEQLANLAGKTANTVGAAGDLQLGGNAAGYNAYTTNQGNIMGAADAYMRGGQNLATQYGNVQNAVQNYSNLGNDAINFQMQSGALPYGAYMQGYGDQFGALSNYLQNAAGISNLGTAGIGPMQNYLGGVMQGAGNAANAASGAQTRTTDQNAQAAAGLGGVLSPIISGGLGWLGNWLGGLGGGSTANQGRGWTYGSIPGMT